MIMKNYTSEKLAEILDKHRAWVEGEEGGERADLSYADLSYANLLGANLRSADLLGANLRDADLSYANLLGADLRSADLSYANLRGADLRSADLLGANLRDANLRDANLRSANLRSADLSCANLSYANLGYANLLGVDLSYANLRGADLGYANLREVSSLNGTYGNCKEVKTIQCDLWPVTYTATHMQIGCQIHLLDEWWEFSDEEIAAMDSRALTWLAIWKPILKLIVDTSPANARKKE